jgi:predicted phage-related endonuclease
LAGEQEGRVVPPLTRVNQAIRAANVTASEVAALMPTGHPYATPERIYDRIVDRAESPTSLAMRVGSALEVPVLRIAEAEFGFRARSNTRTYVHPKVNLCATPDAFAVTRMPWAFVEEQALIEVKVSGRAELWREVPDYIDWQCRAQLACTGRDIVYIVVLAAMRLLWFPVEREAEKEAVLVEAVDAFWRDHIAARVRPEPTVSAPSMPFSFEAGPAIREMEATAS